MVSYQYWLLLVNRLALFVVLRFTLLLLLLKNLNYFNFYSCEPVNLFPNTWSLTSSSSTAPVTYLRADVLVFVLVLELVLYFYVFWMGKYTSYIPCGRRLCISSIFLCYLGGEIKMVLTKAPVTHLVADVLVLVLCYLDGEIHQLHVPCGRRPWTCTIFLCYLDGEMHQLHTYLVADVLVCGFALFLVLVFAFNLPSYFINIISYHKYHIIISYVI